MAGLNQSDTIINNSLQSEFFECILCKLPVYIKVHLFTTLTEIYWQYVSNAN